jgi:hypothetical protein
MHRSQSALLKYWSFEPKDQTDGKDETLSEGAKLAKSTLKTERSVDIASNSSDNTKPRGYTGPSVTLDGGEAMATASGTEEGGTTKPTKLIPVIFFDEAHRLPLLIRDRKAMKCILDAMLVLTKQVRVLSFLGIDYPSLKSLFATYRTG